MSRQFKVGGLRTCKFTQPGLGQEERWEGGLLEKTTMDLEVHQIHAYLALAKTTEPGTLCSLLLLGDQISSMASEEK